MGNLGQEKASTSVCHGSACHEGFGNNCVKQKKVYIGMDKKLFSRVKAHDVKWEFNLH